MFLCRRLDKNFGTTGKNDFPAYLSRCLGIDLSMFVAFCLHSWVPVDLIRFYWSASASIYPVKMSLHCFAGKGMNCVMLAIYTRKTAAVTVSERLKHKMKALKEGICR